MKFSPEIDHFLNTTLDGMGGWCSRTKAAAMIADIIEIKPKRCVEIGIFAGRSLFAAGLALRQVNEGGVIVGIDPWATDDSVKGMGTDTKAGRDNIEWWTALKHEDIFNACMDSLRELGLNEYVQIARQTSNYIHFGYQYGCLGKRCIDFIHIDGNHTEVISTADVEKWMPLVRSGGSVWFDDTNWETTKPAQHLLMEFCDQIGEVEGDGQKCGIFRRK